MKGDATVGFHVQAIKFSRQVLCVVVLDLDSAANTRAGFCHRCRRAPLTCLQVGLLAAKLGESIFELGNSGLELFCIG